MSDRWLPIQYRDFYDVPRVIVVEFRGDLYLFDSSFDETSDDYETSYAVYRLPPSLSKRLNKVSWTNLGQLGTRVGSIEVADVEFDETRRAQINERVFRLLELD